MTSRGVHEVRFLFRTAPPRQSPGGFGQRRQCAPQTAIYGRTALRIEEPRCVSSLPSVTQRPFIIPNFKGRAVQRRPFPGTKRRGRHER
eukprot:2607748-Rhodomonas_salina.1